MSAVEWTSASCPRCAGHGTIAATEGFNTCAECGGAGKLTVQSCCSSHADGHGIPGEDHGGHHHHDARDLPTTLADLMADLDLEDERGRPVKAQEAFKDKVVGLYFSASHCPGCVKFSPTLAGLTESHAADLCTVLVSGDRDEESAVSASVGKGFLRVPFNSPHRGLLMRAFAIYSIPVLAVWHPEMRKSVTQWGHTAVTYNGEKCVRQWHQGSAGQGHGRLVVCLDVPCDS